MIWNVTYRDATGHNAVQSIEASSRKELFKILSQKKITAIKIEESKDSVKVSKASKRKHGIIYLLIGIIAIPIILYIVSYLPKTDTAPQKDNVLKKKAVKTIDVKPTVKPVSITTNNATPRSIKKDRPTKVGERVGDYIKLPSGRIHHIKGERTNTNSRVKQDWFRVFKTKTDNEIALIMTLEPGETVVGTPVYRGGFKNAFLESLNEPISVDPEDSQEIKELKKIVADARKELKAAYDRGEDIDQIMYESRNQFQDLATYRQSLESELRVALKDINSEKEFDDLIAAANQMLEKKGIAPSSLNSISRLKLKFMMNQKKEEKK